MDIFEDARTVSRADLAAWLRQLASQLETTGQVFYGAAGTIAVADQVRCELEIEEEDDEFSIEIEFSWTNPKAAEATDPVESADESDQPEQPAKAEAGTEAESEPEKDAPLAA